MSLAIRREDKPREMRAPLSPSHVRTLVSAGLRVFVQRSSIRVFQDVEYAAAGATLVDSAAEVDAADVILGVKAVSESLLRGGGTYACFAHVIKAQPAGMPLLDALLAKRVRLIDYEAITEGGVRGGPRLVAFGRHAGIAGAIDLLSGLGERCLAALNLATPFLGIAATWQYPSLAKAFDAVRVAGAAIADLGLPDALSPLVVGVTGLSLGADGAVKGGRVACGAREVLELLPVKWVRAADVPAIIASARGRERTHVVYMVAVDIDDCVELARAPSATPPLVEHEWTATRIDRAHYKAAPEEYEATFHRRVLPFLSVLVHCSYWEPRFPRLITAAQVAALAAGDALRLLAIEDISCDINGAVEFMQLTTMGSPFFIYDPLTAATHADLAAAPAGILYSAVDHLPSECPRDASEHFGECLTPLLPELVNFVVSSREGEVAAATCASLSLPIRGAVIVEGGKLAPQWEHVTALRAAQERAAARRATAEALRPISPPSSPGLPADDVEPSTTIVLTGHVFDTGVIGSVLDAIEDASASSEIINCEVGKNRESVTTLRIRVFAPPRSFSAVSDAADALESLVAELRVLVEAKGVRLVVYTEGRLRASPKSNGQQDTPPQLQLPGTESSAVSTIFRPSPRAIAAGASPSNKSVLVIGAGLVSGSCVRKLLRVPGVYLTIADASAAAAEKLAAECAAGPRARTFALDVKDAVALKALVEVHSIVISLVPAPFHRFVTRAAIAARRDMVTSSYASSLVPADELAALHDAAVAAGVTIVNECGLDPGIDHMTILRLVTRVKARGGVITHLSSVCGGLAAPEAATNPLGYKFSWAPRGALVAMLNGATFRDGGASVHVEPGRLLSAARPFSLRSTPALALECLPNRDSTQYAADYGVDGPALLRMFRGTLRYRGFSTRLSLLAAARLLAEPVDALPADVTSADAAGTPVTLRALLAGMLRVDGRDASARALADAAQAAAKSAGDAAAAALPAADAAAFFSWLPLDAPVKIERGEVAGTFKPLDTLAGILSAPWAPRNDMLFHAGERDLTVMQHEIYATFPDGSREEHTSALLEYGVAGAGNVTSMSRTVGCTAAAAAKLLLAGRVVRGQGVCRPLSPEWYEPILVDIEQEDGIRLVETERVLDPGETV